MLRQCFEGRRVVKPAPAERSLCVWPRACLVRPGHFWQPNNAAGYTLAAMVALHYGTYSGLFIKALYFVLGCMLSLVIYSGMRLWFIRREKLVLRHRHTYVLSKFFVAFSIGLIFAYVALVSGLLLPDSLSSPIKNHTGIYFFLMWGVGGIFATKFNSIGAIISPHYFSHKR